MAFSIPLLSLVLGARVQNHEGHLNVLILLGQDASTCLALRFIYCPCSPAISRAAFVFNFCVYVNYYLESVSTFGSHMWVHHIFWFGIILTSMFYWCQKYIFFYFSCSLLSSMSPLNSFKFKYFNVVKILYFICIIFISPSPSPVPSVHPYYLSNLWPLLSNYYCYMYIDILYI